MFSKREIAMLRAALYYWEVQGEMSDCETAHKIAKSGGKKLMQFEREKLDEKLKAEMNR